MQIPEFVKEVVWALYPPRYRQLANKPFGQSLKYMSKVLVVAFLLAGILFIPKLFLLKESFDDGLAKFDKFAFTADISQIDKVSIPRHNPWLVVDINDNLTLSKEFLVIDSDSVDYRLFKIKSIPREQLGDLSANQAVASTFFAALLFLMLPGIALLLYLRMWLKYFLLVVVVGTFFFIVAELTKFKLKWKQMLNVAAHALTLVIFIEVLASAVTAVFLIPILKFLGVSIYLITLLAFFGLIVVGIVGFHLEDRKKR